ncbi:MAG: sugar ABC transporter substrate-binding protein [Lachnospiraceae bacterium]|nr:sugar ABC transporter substrate-binding protein [Lachnospiraceae bacterium]
MKIAKRITAVVLCLVMVIAVMYTGALQNEVREKNIFSGKNSVIIWYTDEAMTDYMNAMAVAFHEEEGIRVIPQLKPGSDYLETIYDASISGEDASDLYIISNESLEKAYLAGLADTILDESNKINTENYPVAALQAVTYHGEKVGYPYYFETSALLYNKTYMMDMAKNRVEAEEEIPAKMEELIPSTFDELLTFADEYDAPAEVEAVFKWDVADIFYNYFFIGNYMDVGGPYGDNTDEFDIYNLDTIKAMQIYQDLNQFFSIDADDVAYDSVIAEFMEGKVVLTTATSDIIKKLDEAKENGEFAYDYGLAEIPELNEELISRSLSVTNTIVVNGFSNQKENANRFAEYLAYNHADTLYEKTGKIPSARAAAKQRPETAVFFEEYADSVPMPKMMETANFWVQLEITFAEVWNGAKVTDCLHDLSTQIMTQITGEEYSEEYIEYQEDETTIEYLDEEAEREAAMQEEE